MFHAVCVQGWDGSIGGMACWVHSRAAKAFLLGDGGRFMGAARQVAVGLFALDRKQGI